MGLVEELNLKAATRYMYDKPIAASNVRDYGLTPKGKPMPQTIEEWKHLVDLDEAAMRRMVEEISKLKSKVNKLTQQKDSLLSRLGESE
tara:strand:+ start:1474 stop:1740 length:267 start_codon:yes stop_codon:yes gene_type:complete